MVVPTLPDLRNFAKSLPDELRQAKSSAQLSVRLFLERGAVVSDVVPPEVPLVLHLLLTDLAVHLPAHRVHVQDVLRTERVD